MAFKTVTTIMTDAKSDWLALLAAIDLTRREKGHLDVICLGIDHTQPGFYYAGSGAIAMDIQIERAREEARALGEVVKAHLKTEDIPFSTQIITGQSLGLGETISHCIRYTDVAVIAQPYGKGRGQSSEAVAEAVLFNASVPLLVVPDDKDAIGPFNKVVVAWNESAEALTAIRSALPVLKAAKTVDIVIVAPPQHNPDRSDPGGALSQMLARHDVRAEVTVLAKTMPRVSDVLNRHVMDVGADLVVMGAYGHSRFRESILGGATRNMLEQAAVPVFLAH